LERLINSRSGTKLKKTGKKVLNKFKPFFPIIFIAKDRRVQKGLLKHPLARALMYIT